MKAAIVECMMGVFAFGETNKLIEKIFFPKDPKETAEKLAKIEIGKTTDEITRLVAKLQRKGYTIFVFESSELARGTREELNIEVEVAKPSEAGESLRRNLDKFAVEVGFAKQASELHKWVHKVSMELTKMRVKGAIEKRDLVVVQAIQTIDDLDATLNLFIGRTREWYGLHFPELDRLIDKHETYARLVANLGRREDFTIENLENEGLPKAKAGHIAKAASASMGASLGSEDTGQIQAISKTLLILHALRKSLEDYIDTTVKNVAPNIDSLAGSLLGARLIALAGGLDNMAKMPASTIQVLGAEKALFRSLRTGTRPPKHGVIFQHNLIHGAKLWHRGKIARALAGNLAIAARADAFSTRYIGDRLKAGVERRVKEIQEKYGKPAIKKVSRTKPSRRKKRGRRR
ncbi:MAG: C/D box methylation guide ribonucleoprotein complex aNOP56 subunit [Candidatus Bathyarchaeota archaeon]|nr:MAG: C/D box methylation guide ribonucleoprotein complex aNOP56 subunit [Candidatus Bathyarchaeota archaeon]